MTIRTVAVALGFLLALPQAGECSGYHPPFDRAVQEAEWIVSHTVVSEHEAQDALERVEFVEGASVRGRVYRVRVERAFKGPFKPSDELLIWDPYYRSTAGYFLDPKGPNLTFLRPSAQWNRGEKWFGSKAIAKEQALQLGLPIRNLSGGPSRGRGDGRKAWERLLELTQLGQRPVPGAEARAALAEDPGEEVLVYYLLTHWGEWQPADGDLVRGALDRHKSAMISTAATKLLSKHGERIGAKTLLRLLQAVEPQGRDPLLAQVVAEGFEGFEPLLGSWIDGDEDGAAKAVEVFGRLAPSSLEQRLRARTLPFWLAIPAFQTLGKRPADLGPEHAKDYDAAALKLASWQLMQARSLAHGNTFGVTHGFKTQQEVWPELLPLLVAELRHLQPEVREVTVAMARSWGFEVSRQGEGATCGARGAPPHEVSVTQEGNDVSVTIRVVVRATRAVLIAKTNGRAISLTAPKGAASSSTTSTAAAAFGRPETPRAEFRRVEAGAVIAEFTEDVTNLLESVRKAEPAGPYRVRVSAVFPSAGVAHGLDAWTGMVASRDLELR